MIEDLRDQTLSRHMQPGNSRERSGSISSLRWTERGLAHDRRSPWGAGFAMRKPAGFDGRPSYRAYLILLLATILAFNGLDGTAIGIVLPSIKGALHLTDTELGFLTGVAFSLFYSTVGVPLGRWADRGDRVAIIAITTALWGVMVVLVGTARSFGQLLIVRIGVAVGEAGCVPAAYSLIGDYFSREERPRAI